MNKELNFYAPNRTSIEQLRIILQARSTEPVTYEDAEEVAELAVEAFTEAAKEFGVMITSGEAKHGYNWADTH